MPIGKIMITNGGVHPSDKWAETTAEQIVDLIQVDPDSDSPAAKAARLAKPRLKLDLQEALEPHHDTVQQHERGKIKEHGLERLSHPLTPEAKHIEDALAAILAKTKDTVFAAHFALPETQTVLRHMIGGHFITSADIERSWHADRNSGHEHAQAYRKARNEHGAGHVHSHIHKYRAAAGHGVPKA